MKKSILLIFTILFFTSSYGCTCDCNWGCSFSSIYDKKEFVALIKVIEYSDYIELNDDNEKTPLSITAEIIKKYKGFESKKRIKIWGDNGMRCRPYISNFKVGKHYLIAPSKIDYDSINGHKDDYDLFSCFTDYLEVDYKNKIAKGNYSWWRKRISLKKFEANLEK